MLDAFLSVLAKPIVLIPLVIVFVIAFCFWIYCQEVATECLAAFFLILAICCGSASLGGLVYNVVKMQNDNAKVLAELEQKQKKREVIREEAKRLCEEGYKMYLYGREIDYKNVHLENYNFDINRKEHKIILY